LNTSPTILARSVTFSASSRSLRAVLCAVTTMRNPSTHFSMTRQSGTDTSGGVRHRSRVPLFRGYLFLRHAMDKASYLEVRKARGLVRMIGERWDRLDAVPDAEIEAIQRLVQSGDPILPYPYLREGQRVRITRGPLADVEGILVRANPKKGLLVVSVNLLRRSVAVQLDCTLLEAA